MKAPPHEDNKVKRLIALTLFALLAIVPAMGQTALDSTTFGEAVDGDERVITLASVADAAVGEIMFAGREAMLINAVNSTETTVEVTRGVNGTRAHSHASGDTVYVNPAARYTSSDKVGTCTAGSEFPNFTPLINVLNGRHFDCSASGRWYAHDNQYQAVFSQGSEVADAVTSVFYNVYQDAIITDIDVSWGTAESTGAMDIQVQRLQGTEACASGDDLLASVIDATGTADTVTAATLTATTALLELSAGERLCVELTATPNEVTEITVNVTLQPLVP